MATPSQPPRRDNDPTDDTTPQHGAPFPLPPASKSPDESTRRERSAASQEASGPAERRRQDPNQGEPRRAIWQNPEKPERQVPGLDDPSPSQRTSPRQGSDENAGDDDEDTPFRNL